MEKLVIICIDDQRDVLAALRKDLEVLNPYCEIIDCESADEAEEVLDDTDASGKQVALVICDHVMPGKSGVDFLIDFDQDPRFAHARTLLLTGMATHEDTIVAINRAHIDRYIEKPWDETRLVNTVKELLTLFVLKYGLDYQQYLNVLDQETLHRELRTSGYG